MAEQAERDALEFETARAAELEVELKATIEELEATRRALVADTPDAKLVAALAAAQAEFPSIPKTKTGTVSGTNRSGQAYSYDYSYADLGDVLAAVRPVLARHGLAVVQRTNLAGELRTELKHVGGGELYSDVALGQSSGNPQAFGGALTYLRRYELVTLLGIAAEEDTDARDVPVNTGRQAAPAPELPPWATDLSRDRLAGELGPRLKVLLGDEAAKVAARTVKDNLGAIPAIVSMTAGLILDTMLAGHPDELVGRLADEQGRRRQAAQAAEAAAEDARQRADAEAAHAAAEAPDAPADDGPAPEEATDAGDADAIPTDPPAPTPAEQARQAAEAVDAGLEEARKRAESSPAGRTMYPDLSGLSSDEATTALRAAGCTCPDPLRALEDEKARVDDCPIIGHGIPF